VDIRLHQRPVVTPMPPPVWGNGHDVSSVALCPMLEVVAANERWVLAHSRNNRADYHTLTNISQK
jgi:hypothetical protein